MHDDDDKYPTTGHEWDGIREYDKPMPRWWLITFYITIVWGLGYTIFYPAWPLINGATPGILGYSSRGEVQAEIDAVNERNAEITAKLVATPLEEIKNDPDLVNFATAGGSAVFDTYCSQCHGSGAQGAKGYPNLLDDDWLWGGSLEEIRATIAHGVRWDSDDDTRYSEMPAFGDILETEEITAVVEYVRKLSNQEFDAAKAEPGAEIYADNCASCHGDTGAGDRDQGAPNLSDAIWLYGGDRDTLTETVVKSRYGMMPSWNTRLSEAEIAQVSYFVHALGGGE